jgi:MFS family permease
LVVIAPLQGYLVDRVGARALILISIPLFGLGVLGLGRLGPHIAFYYLACALIPVAGLGLWPLTYMKMASTWFDRRLGLALGTLNLGNGLGGAILPLLLGVTFALYGWRSAYLMLGLVNLVVCWPMAFMWLRESGGSLQGSKTTRSAPTAGMSFQEVIHSRTFVYLTIGFFVIGVLSAGFLVHQFNILIEMGISKRSATIMQSYLGISSIAGQLLIGWLMDRIAAGRLVALMLALTALACVAYTTSWAAVLAIPCVTAIGFMVGAEMNILGYMIKRYFGERSFGTLYGVIFAIFACGAALGPQILALSRTNLDSYAPGLLAIAALCVAAAMLFLKLTPRTFAMATSGAALTAGVRP